MGFQGFLGKKLIYKKITFNIFFYVIYMSIRKITCNMVKGFRVL
jgi:hypothetical protein